MSQRIPSSSTPPPPSSVEGPLRPYRRFAVDLQQFEDSLPPTTVSRDERERLRRRAGYSKEAVHACTEMASDPLCVERRIELSRAYVDARLSCIDDAHRLARMLRRIAQHVTDDALVMSSDLAIETMQILDLVDVVAARPSGEHLRARVAEARGLVRSERRAAARGRGKPDERASAPAAPSA